MDIADIASLRRRLFREKRGRLEELLEVPLLLYWGKWEGPNIRALTLAEEFTRPTFFLCARGGETVAFVQRIETDQLADLAEEIDIVPYRTTSELRDKLGARLRRYDEVAVEASTDFFALDRFPPNYLNFVSAVVKMREGDDVLVPFRAVKSPLELALMKKASEATMVAFAELEEIVRPGVREEEVLDYLLHKSLEVGDGPAYLPIVASGPRSQHPHPYGRSKKEVEAGERVVVDYGVDFLGYKADVTRTYVAGGEPGEDPYYGISLELAELVRNADLSRITPLELGRRVASVVREAGLSDRERHGYGHGLGVETHDPHPYVAATPMPWLDRPFEDGMIFTFEPGFYDERGGFRIEDDYVVWGGRAVPMQEFEPPA